MVRRQVERKLSIKDGIYDYEYQVPIELEYYEESVVKNLSSCISEVKSVINKLADNEVTPISLESILDDLLGT